MFTKAMEWGYSQTNPAKQVRLFNPANARLRYLSMEEASSLLNACDEPLKTIVLIALHTGMRRGEILKLKWKDIDLVNEIIHIENTKNGKRRDIPMTKTLKGALEKLKLNAVSDWVFVRKDDKTKPLCDIRNIFKRALNKCGISNFTFHDLRHTAASYMVMRGVDLRTVQDILGHNDLRMTMRYSHLSPLHRKKAVEVLDSIGHYLDTGQGFEKNFDNLLELKNAYK